MRSARQIDEANAWKAGWHPPAPQEQVDEGAMMNVW